MLPSQGVAITCCVASTGVLPLPARDAEKNLKHGFKKKSQSTYQMGGDNGSYIVEKLYTTMMG